MKKLFYTLLVVFTCFIGVNSVSAENSISNEYTLSSGNKLYLNGESFTTNMFKTISNGTSINLNFTGSVYMNNISDGDTLPAHFYVRYSLCMDGAFSAGWDNSNVKNVYFYKTNMSCAYYGSSYSGGKIVFAHGDVTTSVLDVNKLSLSHSIGTATFSDVSIGLLGVEFSSSEFPIYNENDTLIKQNDTIINSLNQITSSNNQVIYEQQQTNTKLEETKNAINETNDTLKDDDTSESTSEATEFFEGFDTDTHGLTSIITAPLELIGNIAGSTCSPLPLQVPFVNKTMSLPCMSTIYKKHFGSFLTVYQTITFGIVAYWVCVRIFALVKDFKNPEHDEIEVMDL